MSSAVTSGGGVGSLAPPEIWRLCLTWLERSAEVITASAAGLNAINVFPVADSDTGTNLQQTLTGIIAHLSGEAVDDDWAGRTAVDEPSPADLVVRAAVLSAHGNSGAIVAEMIISLSRALERSGTDRADRARAWAGPGAAGPSPWRAAGRSPARSRARSSRWPRPPPPPPSRPCPMASPSGWPLTRLSVSLACWPSPRSRGPRRPSRCAGRRRSWPSLAAAGVVDAGGQAYVLLLDVLVEILGGPPAVPLPERTACRSDWRARSDRSDGGRPLGVRGHVRPARDGGRRSRRAPRATVGAR